MCYGSGCPYENREGECVKPFGKPWPCVDECPHDTIESTRGEEVEDEGIQDDK